MVLLGLCSPGWQATIRRLGGSMIRCIQHFSFTVSNLEEAIHFFSDILGLEATPIIEVRDELTAKVVGMPGVWLRGSFMLTPGNGTIELIQYVTPKGERIDLNTCNVGVAHISFEVDDIEEMYKDLIAKGVKFVSPPVWGKKGVLKGRGSCYLKGPDGITLEFNQIPKGVKVHPATGFV
ncbi:MAG: VOC family protein, partial [Deltaproteobacteria bacterium]|nr:VOC family protein [Deltaproteobacteria bacterium]